MAAIQRVEDSCCEDVRVTPLQRASRQSAGAVDINQLSGCAALYLLLPEVLILAGGAAATNGLIAQQNSHPRKPN